MNESIRKWYEENAQEVKALADALWERPETAFHEQQGCARNAAFMAAQGFDVKTLSVPEAAGAEPNCVIARYGSGKPVVGILGELDALAGLGQDRVPYRSSREGAGHGCGHNLICAAASGGAAALKQAILDGKLPGTVIYFGCPAEETLEGKVYMAKYGWFQDLDLCLAWHPAPGPLTVMEASMQANTNMFFNFYGKSAHAAANPDQGRSALDAAELMNIGVQYLREHVPEDVRIHYAYTHAGEVPNIVPAYAQVHYFIRAKTRAVNDEIVKRVVDISQGAAKMTGTTTDCRLNVGCYEVFINHAVNRLCRAAAQKVPVILWDKADRNYAAELYKNVRETEAEEDLLPTEIPKLTGVVSHMTGSSDVGDVSHLVPTCQIMGPGIVKGVPFHHWGVTAAAGTGIGHKAVWYAGKTLAQSGYEVFKNPAVLEEIWAEFRESRKNMAPYKPLLPD
ncbi:MAG: amidohydrolase [Treponema sp.]|jgi:aminobenzoyl-glutamate utilization protein B|nr:amidohydrolase [Treponema sp.]